MNDRHEREKEILTSLIVVADHYRSAPTEATFERLYVSRLAYYHGPDLFRVITAIPGTYRDFPSPADIERQIGELRKAAGKGLSEEKIDRHTEELIRGGVSREVAERGARFMRRPGSATPAKPAPSVDLLAQLEDSEDSAEKAKRLLADLEDF